VGRDRRHHDRPALVLQAEELDLIRVYRIPFSTNVERIALAAGHKNVAVEWIDVDPEDRSAVEAVSGQPRVPVLELGGFVLADSPAILEWLEARHPEPSLLPREPSRRAEVRIFVDWFNRVWKRFPNEIEGQLVDAEPDPGTSVAREAAHMLAALELFEGLLDGRDYLCGDFGLADVTAFPFLKYPVLGLQPGDDHLFHRILVDYQPLDGRYPRFEAWVERVDAHPRS
jgi:glutathione S-transferase